MKKKMKYGTLSQRARFIDRPNRVRFICTCGDQWAGGKQVSCKEYRQVAGSFWSRGTQVFLEKSSKSGGGGNGRK